MNTAGDPFYVVKADVEQSLQSIQAQFGRYESSVRGDGAGEVSILRDQIKSSIKNVEWDLQDLDETIAVVLNNRVRFQLSDEEIAARRLFVEEARRQIQAWQSQMTESGPQERLFKGNQRQWNKRRDADKNATSIRNQNSHFIDHEMQMQEHVLEQQDQGLDELASTVKRIGVMGLEMHRELNEQAEILDDVDEEMDSTTNRLRGLQQKLDQIMRETSRGRLCLILWLFAAFIVLTILVVML